MSSWPDRVSATITTSDLDNMLRFLQSRELSLGLVKGSNSFWIVFHFRRHLFYEYLMTKALHMKRNPESAEEDAISAVRDWLMKSYKIPLPQGGDFDFFSYSLDYFEEGTLSYRRQMRESLLPLTEKKAQESQLKCESSTPLDESKAPEVRDSGYVDIFDETITSRKELAIEDPEETEKDTEVVAPVEGDIGKSAANWRKGTSELKPNKQKFWHKFNFMLKKFQDTASRFSVSLLCGQRKE